MFKYLCVFIQSLFGSIDAAFTDAVTSIAAPELRRFGIELEKLSSGAFIGQSQHVWLSISKDRYGTPVFFRVKPLGIEVTERYRWGIDLWWILLALAPDVQFSPKWVRTAWEMRWEVQRQTRLLIAHCTTFLEGDFLEWHRVDELVQLLQRPEDDQEKMRWASEMCALASEAYRQGNYEFAARAYFVLPGCVQMTDVEERQKRDAQRRLDKSRRVFRADEMPEPTDS